MTKDSEALAQAVSAARAVIAYDGAIQTYWARPDSPLIEWGITGIDGVAVEPDYRITHRITGL